MKKLLSVLLAVVMVVTVFSTFGFGVAAKKSDQTTSTTETISKINYSEHMTDKTSYDITGCSITWVKQAKGALIWVPATDTRSDSDIVAQAKSADPSLTNGTDTFDILRGDGVKNTPNTKGSQAKVTVTTAKDGKITLKIDGNYSHFVSGNGGKTINTKDDDKEEGKTEDENAEKVNIRIDTAKKMAVKFEDGNIYYNGDMKEVVVGKEYAFQMASVNWDNGVYDDENGLCGTVVYKMKVVHSKEFFELRELALKDPTRYTVKGMDIIDNEAKTIVINCDAGDFHLETDVNNFFMAYRFHFANGDYDKQTGIKGVINTPIESLSVNLPLGATIKCDAYKSLEQIDTANVFIENNNGTGVYEDVYLTSVNDYTWNH